MYNDIISFTEAAATGGPDDVKTWQHGTKQNNKAAVDVDYWEKYSTNDNHSNNSFLNTYYNVHSNLMFCLLVHVIIFDTFDIQTVSNQKDTS